ATAEAPAEATEEAPAETAAAEEAATAEAEETVEVAAAPAAEEAPAADSLYASASAEDGRKIFRQCSACHVAEDGKNRVGPHLWGVVGRGVGSVEGYKYSDAMTGFGWHERLDVDAGLAWIEARRREEGREGPVVGWGRSLGAAALVYALDPQRESAAPLSVDGLVLE
ncbi:MAG: c-type cytochrome, partial [Planctomycetota bacterium]